jgi:NADPH-dependent glutamate synthase beta subunit-like oxidoreductase/formate hydrogenlyase subunit 6/NADH:ubiquinone oxidoreductase subunit I
MPKAPAKTNGRKVACLGAGPASLTVARDLAVLGYEVTLFDQNPQLGGMIRTQIPAFRLPVSVIDEEMDYITSIGNINFVHKKIESLKEILDEGWDAVFVGTGAPRGRDLDIPGREDAEANFQIGIDFLSSVSFGHIDKIGKRVIVLGGGNTAMDCCRTARRLGGEDVKVIVRSGFDEMKASPWEKDDAMAEDIPFINFETPKSFVIEDGKLVGMTFEKVKAEYDENGRRKLVPTGEPDPFYPCDDVLCAIGQENSFPWIERDIGLDFDDRWDMPVVDRVTFQSTHPKVFFGGDAAFGPENIIWAASHGHDAAISIHKMLEGEDIKDRPAPLQDIVSQKMGIHEWSYDNDIAVDARFKVPHLEKTKALTDMKAEVELGFDFDLAWKEAQRCLNCDVQTVFSTNLCIECDACVDICPMDCITFTPNGEEVDVRQRLTAPALNTEQDLYVSDPLPTARIMVKDEDVCLHCGLCAERCPTGAWDMQKHYIEMTHAGSACRNL